MENTTFSIEAIEKEIRIFEEIKEQFNTELTNLSAESKQLTERINVLTALESKFPPSGTQALITANIKMLVDERFQLIPEIRKAESSIQHHNKIIEKLNELHQEHV